MYMRFKILVQEIVATMYTHTHTHPYIVFTHPHLYQTIDYHTMSNNNRDKMTTAIGPVPLLIHLLHSHLHVLWGKQ